MTRPIDPISAPPLPELSEGGAIDLDLVNGVDPGNLVLGPNADATITFRDEVARFQNTLGVVLVGADGTLGPGRVVFAQVEHAEADPRFPAARPGGGPLAAGDEVRLSELYTADQLAEGQQFAFFTVAEGFRLNGDLSGAELVFLNDDGSPASVDDPAPNLFAVQPDGTLVPLAGNVFHTATPNPDDPLSDPLNDGGLGQVLSGLEPDAAGLTITFEDLRLNLDDNGGDNDFNDVTYEVLLEPSTGSSLDFVDLDVAVDAAVVDDDANLSGAVAEITLGEQAGDALRVDLPAGSAISVVEDGSSGRLVLAGEASLADYVAALRSIQLGAAAEGLREITFTVADARGAESLPAVVRVNLTTAGAQFGDENDNILIGEVGVDDAIAGRRGDDQLFGLSGDDVLDGGLGDDRLFGDDTLAAASDGDDVLIGGPGADMLDRRRRRRSPPVLHADRARRHDRGLRRGCGRHARFQRAVPGRRGSGRGRPLRALRSGRRRRRGQRRQGRRGRRFRLHRDGDADRSERRDHGSGRGRQRQPGGLSGGRRIDSGFQPRGGRDRPAGACRRGGAPLQRRRRARPRRGSITRHRP